MILNNDLLKLLSEFSFLAKNIIGNIKLTALINDPIYARNTYVKTALSRNATLIFLVKKIHEASLKPNDEFNAVDGYLSKIESFHDETYTQNTKQHLNELLIFLMRHQVTDTISYRHEIDLFLLTVPIDQRALYKELARDFYHFWVYERTSPKAYFSTNNLNYVKNEKLFMHWAAAQKVSSLVVSGSALEQYIQSMQQFELDEQIVRTRVTIARLLINAINTSTSSDNAYAYRTAVDSVQELFSNQELQTAFLEVAREFYYFHISIRDVDYS